MKTVTIAELEKKGSKATDPIWALNTAAESEIEAAAEILLTIPKRNGSGNDPLRIPQTWLPQELTKSIPRAQLLVSTEFRQAVNSKLITLIPDTEAKRILGQEGSEDEANRLEEQRRHIRKAGAARSISDSTAEITRIGGGRDDDDEDGSGRNKVKTFTITDDDEEDDNVAKKALAGVENNFKGISPAFEMWVNKLNTGKDITALNEIKARRKFTPDELAYVAKKLNVGFEKSLAMVKKNLNKK